ncbi:MAG: ABC transporter permease [Planctomycetota bacterium]|nr:MAG: ABC transporter permease [Planctomycetota bacterium]
MRKWVALLLAYLVLGAAAALHLVGADHAVQHYGRESVPPGAGFWLGTDHLGRDVLALTLQGLRISLQVGTVAAGLAVSLGAALGMAAGWYRGAVDRAAVWLSSAVAAIPAILLILAIGFMLGQGYLSAIAAIAAVSWVGVFRVVRAETERQKTRDYVLAARGAGAGTLQVLPRHILPNLLPMLLVQLALHFVYAVNTEVILSFLGVGVAEQPSWGRTILFGVHDLAEGHPWPLAAVTVAMFGLIFPVQRLADHLRDRLDPRAAAPR